MRDYCEQLMNKDMAKVSTGRAEAQAILFSVQPTIHYQNLDFGRYGGSRQSIIY